MTTSTGSENEGNTRIFGLDLLRALAIILVVLSHGQFLLEGTPLRGFPFIKLVDGVDLFFVLSGFLIGGIILHEINKDERYNYKSVFRFWLRRWFRTLPNYYLILIINIIIVYFGWVEEDISMFNWKFFFFVHNFIHPFYGFFWESWSLSVEEWFYFIFPLLLFFARSFIRPMQAYFIFTLAMIAIPLYLRHFAFDPRLDDFWMDVSRRKVVVFRLDSIAFGLLAAWLYYYFKLLLQKISSILFITGILLLVLFNYVDRSSGSYIGQVLQFSIVPFSVMLLLPKLASWNMKRSWLNRVITHISKISYSMYLINLGIVAALIRDNFATFYDFQGIFVYVVYWALVIGFSSLLYYYFEKPVMNLRDKF
jgi:peptidoglycan/LPS O-acetylase OafA/YrhL